MRETDVLVLALLLAVGPPSRSASGQAPAGVETPAAQETPRRPETQAVVDRCRELGREAETPHTLMVFRAAQAILKVKAGFPEIQAADPKTTEIATMLHDIAGGGLVNAKPGAVIARDVLTSLKDRLGLTDGFIDQVARIVETHHVTGTVRGQDDSPEWYVVLLADTRGIYTASPADGEAFARLLRDRIDQLKLAIQ
jgi:hypothetical protein